MKLTLNLCIWTYNIASGLRRLAIFKILLNKPKHMVHIWRTPEDNIRFIVIILLIVSLLTLYIYNFQAGNLYNDCIIRMYPIFTTVTLFEMALMLSLRVTINTLLDYMKA